MNIRASNGQYSKGSGHEWVKTTETCHIVVLLLGFTCTACKQEYRGMSVHIGPALLQAASTRVLYKLHGSWSAVKAGWAFILVFVT